MGLRYLLCKVHVLHLSEDWKHPRRYTVTLISHVFYCIALQTSILILPHTPIPTFTSSHSPCVLPTFLLTYDYCCCTNLIQA